MNKYRLGASFTLVPLLLATPEAITNLTVPRPESLSQALL